MSTEISTRLPWWLRWQRIGLQLQATQVPSQGRQDPLEEKMATHSSIFNLENPMDTGAWKAAVRGVSESNMTE